MNDRHGSWCISSALARSGCSANIKSKESASQSLAAAAANQLVFLVGPHFLSRASTRKAIASCRAPSEDSARCYPWQNAVHPACVQAAPRLSPAHVFPVWFATVSCLTLTTGPRLWLGFMPAVPSLGFYESRVLCFVNVQPYCLTKHFGTNQQTPEKCLRPSFYPRSCPFVVPSPCHLQSLAISQKVSIFKLDLGTT